MAWAHGGTPTRLSIRYDIEQVLRHWPKIQIHVKRHQQTFNDFGELVESFWPVYTGPALSRPAGGTTETYGLGTVENYTLVILVNGVFDIRQGDVVTINDGREYEVQYPPEHFNAFTELRLNQRSQIRQPI